jgi:hypothetical protein
MEKPKLSQEEKQKLKKAFDLSHFDINAILRGIQLTLVGGEKKTHPTLCPIHDDNYLIMSAKLTASYPSCSLQRIVHYKIPKSSPMITTDKQPWLSLPA